MEKNNFDIFVIGGGSGGVRAARVAASKGFKVGLAEGWDLGGTCVNRGCIPKKLYSFCAHFSEEINLMKSFGWSIKKKKFDWKKLVKNKKKELKRLNKIYFQLLKDSGVSIFNGYAKFINEKSIRVGKKQIFAEKFLIAVGTKPKRLDFLSSNKIITSDEAFDIKNLPNKILILGGGYIAVEFASIFNGLGVDTSISLRGKKILKNFDDDVSIFLMDQMKSKGVRFLTENFPAEIKKNNKSFQVTFKNCTNEKFDLVMEATGREPNTSFLELENAGVKVSESGSINVDKYFSTSKKNIFAIGDIISRVQLTPVAIAEAMNFVENLSSKKKIKFNYKNIPTAVFSDPSMAYVGLSEKEARKKYRNIEIFVSKFKPLKNTLANSNEKVFVKLIINSSSKKILGIHFVGENAAEIIQGFSVAVVNGLTKDQIDKTIGIHPTSAEELVTMKSST